jgi:sec-independent protein translocase protein TatC
MSTIISTVFYTGLFFLLPIVTYFLTKIGLFDSAFLKKYRKHAIVIILILAAIITPPDWITQLIVSVPLVILYEVGVLIAVRVEKNNLKNK